MFSGNFLAPLKWSSQTENKNEEESNRKFKTFNFVISTLPLIVAIHKIKDVITNYDKQGPNSHNNYGLTGNQQQNVRDIFCCLALGNLNS